ncbi:phage tail protein I [Tumebacillus flagellatus]|uniref:Tail protein n=1 Tax=Tumebacillus flagellatus TaxID=1157490 RepID=A0A074LXC9_9BACL|nr:phage tail protein I [Tumebacillus flagellatus]KEO84748.1 tail protein [Tumebacillus flagellatus]
MLDLKTVHLLDLVPPNIRDDPTVAAAAEAINGELQAVNSLIPLVSLMKTLDAQAEDVVDELAWQFHVDFYDPSLSIEQKRALVKNSISWHRRKGTPAAVEELIATLFGEGRVEEWFEYDGEPYTFRVITNNPAVTEEKALEFARAVNSVKNTRSRLDKVIVGDSKRMPLYIGFAVHIGEKLTIRQV